METVVTKNPDKAGAGTGRRLGLAWRAEATSSSRRPSRKSPVRSNYGDCPNVRTLGALPATGTIAGEAEGELF